MLLAPAGMYSLGPAAAFVTFYFLLCQAQDMLTGLTLVIVLVVRKGGGGGP